MMHQKSEARIIELAKSDAYLSELKSKYFTSEYYDVSVCRESGGWSIRLSLKPLEKTLEKEYKGRLFEDHVEEARVFVAMLRDRKVGWIELGYDKWNNRMRVWEFLVDEGFRRRGIGTLLMNYAVKIAKDRGARMLVLETQTCDVPAIRFYLNFGFELIGFDVAAYSNEDIKRKEVRLEFGLKLS
jgi:ribosomal protein S18 acetylase RimI-like enzyme